MNIDVYTDVSCPWCYIATHRLQRAIEGLENAADVHVAYRPYQLNPAMSTKPMPLMDYYVARGGTAFAEEHRHAARVALADGLPVDLDRAQAVNTFDAHRVLWIAREEYGAEVQQRVHDGLTRAFFADGANIGDIEVLTGIAARSGMDASRTREELTGDAAVSEVREAIDAARGLGISAVPSFVIDGTYLVKGAQQEQVLRDILTSRLG